MIVLAVVGALTAGAIAVTSAEAFTRDPAGRVQAEDFVSMSGAQVEPTGDSSGSKDVGWLGSGDWLRYRGINLGSGGRLTAAIRIASDNPGSGTLELRADSVTGPVLAGYTIRSTGGWQTWITRAQTNPSTLRGLHDVVITLHSPQPADFVNINWFSLVDTTDGSGGSGGTDGTAVVGPAGHTAPTSTATGRVSPVVVTAPAGGATASAVPPAAGPGATGHRGPGGAGHAGHPGAGPGLARSPGAQGPTVTMAPVRPGAWLDVDPVAQAAATRDFFARTPRPPVAETDRVAQFRVQCSVSHHAADDPIVYPGQFGVSHDHTFIGNRTTDADSSLSSLRAGDTTCTPSGDRSAYWVPTLYQDGKVVDPEGTIDIYYGSKLKDPSRVQPFPAGFRMIAGDARIQTDSPDRQGNHFWCAGIGGEVGRTADGLFPVCASTARLNRQITFPDCWDGRHLDSPDHRSHVAGSVDGHCPTAYPVAIPSISFVIAYPLNTDTTGITLASGTAFSMHADFFNAWDDEALAQRVRNCIDQDIRCNPEGEPGPLPAAP